MGVTKKSSKFLKYLARHPIQYVLHRKQVENITDTTQKEKRQKGYHKRTTKPSYTLRLDCPFRTQRTL